VAAHGFQDLFAGRDTAEAEASAFLFADCVRVMTGAWSKR